MKKYEISQAALAAYSATWEVVKQGDVGLDFTCPETASIRWTPEALLHVVKAVLETGEWVDDLSQWVEELLYDAGTTPAKLLRCHPDYDAALAEFEDDFAEDREEIRRDARDRAIDARLAQ